METIYLDETSLTFDQVSAMAYGQSNAPWVEISAEAARLVTRATPSYSAPDKFIPSLNT